MCLECGTSRKPVDDKPNVASLLDQVTVDNTGDGAKAPEGFETPWVMPNFNRNALKCPLTKVNVSDLVMTFTKKILDVIVARLTCELDLTYMPLAAMYISFRSRYFRQSSVPESLPWPAERSIMGKKDFLYLIGSKTSNSAVRMFSKTYGIILAVLKELLKELTWIKPFRSSSGSKETENAMANRYLEEILKLSNFAMKNVLDKERAERAATALMRALPTGMNTFFFVCFIVDMMIIQISLQNRQIPKVRLLNQPK